jgi:hypothetical protein
MPIVERAKPIIWLALGLLIGAGMGALIGWVVWPTQFTEADPTVLQESYQQDYATMIAANYALDGDLVGARRRLFQLGVDNLEGWLLDLTVATILSGTAEQDAIFLVNLCRDLEIYSPLMEPYLTDE